MILPGKRSLCGSQPPSLARSWTSSQEKVTPISYKKPAATQASATIVLIACQSRTCTASQPKHVARKLETVFDSPSLTVHAKDAQSVGFGFHRPARDTPPPFPGALYT